MTNVDNTCATDLYGLPRVDPSEVGLAPDRLARLDAHVARYVDDGRLSGWQMVVTRDGKLAHAARCGLADREAGRPVADDTVWRIYSMTKPITAVAALMLWEEGKFELNDPVRRFIPEFGDSKVFLGGTFLKPVLGPQTEPMRIWHLLTHTAGLTYGFMYSHPVDELYRRAGLEWGFPRDLDLAGLCSLFAGLPLLFQPGSEWNYSVATDVLGRVVEVASGMRLADFLRQRIVEPLGMRDSGFFLPEDQAHRLSALYAASPKRDSDGVVRAVRADGADRGALVPPKADGGGGGLVSTTPDYVRFAEMLRRGGELNGQRLLSPRNVSYMASNHLPGNADLAEFGRPLFAETPYDGVGFGLGVSVTLDPAAAKTPGSVGDFGWGGAASTWFMVDPVEDLTVTFMTQLMPSSTHPIRSQVKQLLHQALVD
ncbi:MAG: serine hydrolase domain-containing protein [Ilumatobacteraceae bacterium]